ncbi:unnamed protein product [Effrenium voratum]|uniref:Uncharacterized protein n=1 Tax=Effrenium voratum TaxID=2562239 RepID=A0AA36MWV0_9DINO|nr:unnamed protein product [Effrenium voratum]
MAALPPWKKVLYLKQPYEDNYVDESFLDSLVLNANVQRYEFWSLCSGTLAILWQLSLVVVFVSVWWRVQQLTWNLNWLLALDGLLFGCFVCGWRRDKAEALWDVLNACKIVFPLWVLAPLLQTLTRSWSDDTIAVIASALLFLHVASYRYQDVADHHGIPASKRVSPAHSLPGGPTALNAAVLAATILASRLQTAEEVFAFMSFAMEVFALPRARFPAQEYWISLAVAGRTHRGGAGGAIPLRHRHAGVWLGSSSLCVGLWCDYLSQSSSVYVGSEVQS